MDTTTQKTTEQVYSEPIGSETFMQNVKTYLLNPLSTGLAGFAAFFTLIFLTKLFSYIIGTNDAFDVNIQDVIYSLTGFVCAAGARFFEFFGKED
jgi:hypothetical protein